METRWLKTFQAWALELEFGARVHDAEARIETSLEQHDKPYVAYSGGKDSSVLLHLVTRRLPGIMVLHWDYGRHYIPDPVREEIMRNAHTLGARNLRVETSSEYERLGRRAINVLGRQMIGRLLPRLRKEGYDLAFVGLRAQESLKRRRRMRAQSYVSDIEECWPLRDWTWMDVMAYMVSRQLPYLSLYDRMAELIGWDRVRFVTLFDPEFDRLGTGSMDGVLHWRWKHETET